MTTHHLRRLALAAVLAVIGLLATACVDSNSAAEIPPGTLRIAIVAPSASNDRSFTQSLVEGVKALGDRVQYVITNNASREEAAVTIRDYAKEGYDLIIAHGSQDGGSLQEIALDFPDVSFAWGTARDTFGLDNVYAYTAASEQGGFVLGTIAAQLTETGAAGVVGPIEVGDAKFFIDGFEAGVEFQNSAVDVNTVYIGSFSNYSRAVETTKALIAQGADILTSSAQIAVGAIGVARDEKVLWLGNQADQSSLAVDFVVASQVYRWEVILEEILDSIEGGVKGGRAFTITLENGGLEIVYNNAYDLPADVRTRAGEIASGIIDGSIDPSS